MDLTVSIISGGNRELLRDCLKSIFQYTRNISFEVWVVDNACNSSISEMIHSEFPCVNLLRNVQRQSFTVNHNQVLSHSRGRYILFLNDDTESGVGTLDGLVNFMDKHQQAGAVGCRILNPDGSFQGGCSKDLTPFRAIIRKFLNKLWPESSISRGFYPLDKYETVFEPEVVSGACILARKEALEQIGGFDEKFLFYYEEYDLCAGLRKQGWRLFYIPDVYIIHYIGRSLTYVTISREMKFKGLKTRYIYFQKHFGIFSTVVVRAFDIAEEIFGLLKCLVLGIYSENSTLRERVMDQLRKIAISLGFKM